MERTNGITKKQSRAMAWIFIFLLAFALFLDVGLTLIPVFGWEGVWRSLAIDLVNETPFLFIFELLTLSGISFQFHPITLLLWIPCLLEMVLPMTFFLVSRRGFKKRQIWLLAVPGVFIVLRLGLRADGTVLAVGHNDYGQCNVSGWTDIVAIAGNMWATFGLKSDGTVVYTGGPDARDRAKLDAVKRWDDIVSIKAYDSTDVFGIKADGTIVDINERLVDINERIKSDTVGLDVAYSDWRGTAIYLSPDGSVKSRKTDIEAAFSGNKIQAPSQYELATDGNDETAQNTGIWTVRAYIDEFNLPTDEYYITNETAFIGTFSNSATTNSTLAAYLFCEQYDGNDMLRIRLLEYGSSRVNNPYSSTRYYDITVMDADGVRYYTEGSMYSGSYDVYVLDEQLVLDALKKGGTVRLAITERDDPLTNYIITIDDANGFSAAYYEFWNS